ncbi:ATP-binding cassette domain-containing protein [Hydrogenophaga sp.]|uniref:ABC transporter ATP-binding protein n=1 Tax=Hydrogenophaga sp. TaxID=1904254 RepID=UPI003563F3A8
MTEHFLWRADGLGFSWPGCTLFQNWSQRIRAGVTAVYGDESSGKSTLLQLMAGALAPQAGRLELNGVSLDQNARRYQEQVYWMDPRTEAHDQQSARNYLQTLPALYAGFAPQTLDHMVQGLSLTDFLDKPLYMLSTGSKRKVWLAAGFASGAPLVLMNKPFAALDKPSIAFLRECLQEASVHPSRAWVLADYERPEGVPLAGSIALPG